MKNRLDVITETVQAIMEVRKRRGRQPGRRVIRSQSGTPAGPSERASTKASGGDRWTGPDPDNRRRRDEMGTDDRMVSDPWGPLTGQYGNILVRGHSI